MERIHHTRAGRGRVGTACLLVLTAILTAAAARPVRAGFTTEHDFGAEPGDRQILDHLYGGGFVADGASFANGAVTARRVPDTAAGGPGSPLGAADGPAAGATDQVWRDAVVSARARARFASYDQTFGIAPGADGRAVVPLLTVSGYGFDATGSSGPVNLGGRTWRWARGGTGPTFSSRPSDNPGGADQMVAYQVLGLPDAARARTWLLLFEDIPLGGDGDFNDMVVEVKATPAAVPLPPAAWSAAAFAGGVGVLRGIRLLRRRR